MEGLDKLGCPHVSQSNKIILKNYTVVSRQFKDEKKTKANDAQCTHQPSTKDACSGAG